MGSTDAVNYLPLIATALSGGMAGSIITLTTQAGIRHWNRPILGAVTTADGCNVQTKGWRVDYEGKVIEDGTGNHIWVDQCYLRLMLTNRGNTFAKAVSVSVTRITYTPRSGGQTTFNAEVFDLKLALTRDRSVFNLASRSHRFVDFVHSQRGTDLKPFLLFDFVNGSSLLSQQNFGAGSYKFDVALTAENASSSSLEVNWTWDGTFDGIKF
jgi:hypothetical protein